MRQSGRIIALIAALSAATACSADPTGVAPRPGMLVLRLTSPHGDDGALTFELIGPPVDSATAANGSLRLFTRRASDSTLVGVVAGVVAGGPIVILHVPDGVTAERYTARIGEVADLQDRLRASLTGYAIVSGPPAAAPETRPSTRATGDWH